MHAVMFGSVPAASFVVDSPTQMRVVVPQGATEAPITVVTSMGLGVSAFSVVPTSKPQIYNANASAQFPGGWIVSIYGRTLSGANAIYFDGNQVQPGAYSIISDTQIDVIIDEYTVLPQVIEIHTMCGTTNASVVLGLLATLTTEDTGEKKSSSASVNNQLRLNIAPNPTTQTTELRYELPEQATVTIEILNTMQQQVNGALRLPKQAGGKVHREQLDVSHLSAGVYTIRVKAVGATGRLYQQVIPLIVTR